MLFVWNTFIWEAYKKKYTFIWEKRQTHKIRIHVFLDELYENNAFCHESGLYRIHAQKKNPKLNQSSLFKPENGLNTVSFNVISMLFFRSISGKNKTSGL